MRAVLIGLTALVMTTGSVAAQVPVMTDTGWRLPTRDDTRAQSADYSVSGGSYEAQIEEACAYYGCDPNYLISIMYCESGGDHSAVAYNPQSGNYTYGIFQIDGMWGGGGMSPTEQIWWTAEHVAKGDVWWACG